jgi:hypothetical protein
MAHQFSKIMFTDSIKKLQERFAILEEPETCLFRGGEPQN